MLRERVLTENTLADPYDRESVFEAAHPLKLAEEIGFLALDAVQCIAPQRYPENITIGWNLVEKALAAKDLETKQGFLNAARLRFETAEFDPSGIDSSIRISTTLAALPSFMARSYGKQPSQRIVAETYQNMSHMLSRVGERPELSGGNLRNEEDEEILGAHGALVESLTYTVLLPHSKAGFFPYIAGPREDMSIREFSNYNHDLYTLDKEVGKLPVQVKRNEEDAEAKAEWRLHNGVATVVLNPLIAEEAYNLWKEMQTNRYDTSWFVDYRETERPDTFLAQCLESDKNAFPSAHHAYAASELVTRVGNAVVRVLQPQFDVLRERATRIPAS